MRPLSGYTLMELVVVIVLLGILSGFLAITLAEGARAYIDLRSRSANASDAAHALELMCRDIQEIRAIADVTAMSDVTLNFTDVSGSSVAYAFSGTVLTRNTWTLLDRLQSFSFAYKKKDGTAATAVADLWTVEVNLVLERSGRTLTLRTRVFPRNLSTKWKTWQKT